MGTNIGKVGLKVVFRDRSPFSPQPKQEVFHFFTKEVVAAMQSTNIDTIPEPIHGIRNSEDPQNYDNFLEDSDGSNYPDSFYSSEVTTTEDDGSTTTTTISSPSDPPAAARQNQAQGANQAPAGGGVAAGAANAAVTSAASKLPQNQIDFFTWQVSSNLFMIDSSNPPARKFTDPPTNDNAAEFTYGQQVRGGANGKSFITPFMKKSPPDRSHPIHWGAKMKEALGKNQPFEMTYYFCARDPAIADTAVSLTPRYTFLDQSGKPLSSSLDLDLTKSVYVAIEIGLGNTRDNYLLLFKADSEPMLFQLGGSGSQQTATILSTFSEFNSSKIFDPNHKVFTVKVEPVLGNFVITSNAFGDKPWVVTVPPSTPIFIGKGPLAIYAGNVQAGWSMRPVQYVPSGTILTTESTYILFGGGMPQCSASTKGSGDIEQNRSYSPGDPASVGTVNMLDAEQVNGEAVITILEANSAEASKDINTKRAIDIAAVQVANDDTDPNAQPGPTSGSDDSSSVEMTYKVQVDLTSGDVTQGNGYVVKLGRSPYIWMVRCQVNPLPGQNPIDQTDITCDVMSVDLQWNATSYNEISYNGTIKVLNRRQATIDNPRAPIDYRSYMNRAVYVRIEAYWRDGAGFDPGPNNRQIFEGLTVGAEINSRAENDIITFKVEDYMNVLQNSKFVLSPPYDGMSVSLAARDIVMQTGLPDARILADDVPIAKANLQNDLGLGFVTLYDKPTYVFQDGTSYKDALLKFAKLDFKCVYFDRFGNFHFDTMPGGVFANGAFVIKEKFWSSQIEAAANGDQITPQKLYKVAWNQTSLSRLINDVYNVISVSTVTKLLGARVSANSTYKAGIFDPTAEGYLGYRKHLMIAEPALGDVAATFRYLDNYRRRVFIPPLTVRFETYGYSGLKPLDIIQFNGQQVRILNISTHINAQENLYYMNIEGEWFFSAGKGQDPQLNGAQEQVAAGGGSDSEDQSPGESSRN